MSNHLRWGDVAGDTGFAAPELATGMSYPVGGRRGEAAGSSEEAGGTLAWSALGAAALLSPLYAVVSAMVAAAAPVSTTAGTGPVPQECVVSVLLCLTA